MLRYNTFINFTADAPAATSHWGASPFVAQNSIITASGSGRFVWPGFGGSANTVGNPATLNLRGSRLRHINADGTIVWILNMGAAALTGNDFTGLIFDEGVIPYPVPGQVDWVNVTFGPTTADSDQTGQGYMRFNGTTSTITAFWDGFFGCDFAQWTDSGADSLASIVNATDFPNSRLAVFYANNTYSPEILARGLRIHTRTLDAPLDVFAGLATNPAFRDSVDLSAVDDVVIDLGDNPVHLGFAEGTADVKNALPTGSGSICW